MITRLFVLSVSLGCLVLLWTGEVRAQSPHLNKALVRVANPGALSMSGMAMPNETFPNNYDSEVSMSFSPNTGTNNQGILTVSYTFTGTTQPNPMCSNSNAHHYPRVTVHMVNNGVNKSYHSTQGYQVAPCVQMNQTVSLSFDIGFDSCDITYLMNGICELQEDTDEVYCTVAGAFALFIKGFEIEGATTVDQVVGIYPPWLLAQWCAPSSSPPDWHGPAGADSFGTGYWVSTEFMERTQILGLSFYGVPWKPVFPVGPAAEFPSGGPKPICTMWDHGCSFVDQTCTAQANPVEIHGEQVWRRNA